MSATRREVFDAVLAENESGLISYAGLFVHDIALAREVVREVFLRFAKQVPIEGGASARLQLFVSCRQRARAIQRKSPAAAGNPPWRKAAGETASSGEQDTGSLEAAHLLLYLGEKLREPIVLFFRHGFTVREISRITHQSPGNIVFLLHTGMKRLRDNALS